MESHPLFKPPPSDTRPHTRGELRAAYKERINEAGLQAETMYRGITHGDREETIDWLRQLLKMIEYMRITLEREGYKPPALIFEQVEE
jgi:hypothetical protein